MSVEEQLTEISRRLDIINMELGKLIGAKDTTTMLVRYIILPLILILGALVGVKVVLP